MTVRIVTDSLSDITSDLASQMGISVVPVCVRFGEKVYRDRIDMTTDEFYRRLVQEDVWPTTTQATPSDFARVYEKLAKETGEILTVSVSSKLSGTHESALAARKMVDVKCRIEVIDSRAVVMGLGLIVLAAAKAAQEGASLDELVRQVQSNIARAQTVMVFDTLKYLAKGGRIGKAKGFLGSLLSVKPILTMRQGEVAPLTRVRSMRAGMDYLYQFAASQGRIEGLAVEHATTSETAHQLLMRFGTLFPKDRILFSTVSPVIGTYTGPNVISISMLSILS